MLAGQLSDKMDLAGAEVKLLTGTVFALKTDPQAQPRPARSTTLGGDA